jgi:hypothetical protein
MSEPSGGITFRTMQEMMPEYNIPPDLIEDVVAALPSPPADTSAEWRYARLDRIVEEIASRVPMNAAQASLTGQIVVVQSLAIDLARQVGAPGVAMGDMLRLLRMTDLLMNTTGRLEHTLERRQFRVMSSRDVRPVDRIDMVVLDGVWCRKPPRMRGDGPEPAPAPRRAPEKPEVADGPVTPIMTQQAPAMPRQAPAATKPETPAATQTVETPAATHTAGAEAAAQAAATQTAATSTATQAPATQTAEARASAQRARLAGREDVTFEQGEGWSLEVWPARPGPARGPDATTEAAAAAPRAAALAGSNRPSAGRSDLGHGTTIALPDRSDVAGPSASA